MCDVTEGDTTGLSPDTPLGCGDDGGSSTVSSGGTTLAPSNPPSNVTLDSGCCTLSFTPPTSIKDGPNPNPGFALFPAIFGNGWVGVGSGSTPTYSANSTSHQDVSTVSTPPKTGIKTLNCAGYTASRSIFAQTRAQTIEFGGFIEKAPNGTYLYTPPFAGNRTSLPNFYDQYNSLVQGLSKGFSVTGWYHSHPVPPPTYPSAEAFSGQDLSVSHYLNAPGFVVTPSGAVLRLDPGPPAVTTRVPSNVCQGG